jgi:hypothetical protein
MTDHIIYLFSNYNDYTKIDNACSNYFGWKFGCWVNLVAAKAEDSNAGRDSAGKLKEKLTYPRRGFCSGFFLLNSSQKAEQQAGDKAVGQFPAIEAVSIAFHRLGQGGDFFLSLFPNLAAT